jgi:signal transduction histidine kinase
MSSTNDRDTRAGEKRPVQADREFDTGTYKTIARAKLEWEGAVDALKDFVCLVDGLGRIVRANRAVEQWRLGNVGEVIGRTPHELLHPDCATDRCTLDLALGRAWRSLGEGAPADFEHPGTTRDCHWHVSMRPLLADAEDERHLGESFSVLVVSDVSALHKARNALETLNAELESRVLARTRELADTNRDLRNEVARRQAAEAAQRNSLNELARLSEALIKAQESERRRIAIELHDSVGQSLTAVKYTLERAVEMLRRAGYMEAESVIELALGGLQQATDSSRAIAMNLRPAILDDMGAVSAVGWFCRQFAEFYPNLRVETLLKAVDGDIPDRLGTAVFRTAQELLNNTAKHAQASVVTVRLERGGRNLWIEVRDDGIGIPERLRDPTVQGGHGIRNLRERAEMTGGRLSIKRANPSGTVARINWALMDDEVGGTEEAWGHK